MKLNKETKKAKNLINTYNKSNMFDIWQAYQRPSKAKIDIWEKWQNIAYQNNAKGLKICTNSKFVFTLAFLTKENDKTILNYITPTNNFKIEID